MKYLVLFILATSAFAGDLSSYQKKLLTAISKIDGDYKLEIEQAKLIKNARIKRTLANYLKAVKRLKEYWTKKGNLNRALVMDREQRRVERTLGIKRPRPVQYDTIKLPTVDTEVSQEMVE